MIMFKYPSGFCIRLLALLLCLACALGFATESSQAAPSAAKTVLFIGDSYSEGKGAGTVAKRFTTLTADAMGWREVNAAQGCTGYVAQCWLGHKLHISYEAVLQTINIQPDIVIVSGGRNDKWTSNTSASIYWFYACLHAKFPKAQLFATSPIWGSSRKPPAKLQLLQTAVRTAALGNGATYIDLGNPLLGHPEYMAKDAIHPNVSGHAAIANALIRSLANLVPAN
jgi:lysophospholipase L1-like esterase